MKKLLTVAIITTLTAVSCTKQQMLELNKADKLAAEAVSARALNVVPLGAVGSNQQDFTEKVTGPAESLDRLQMTMIWSDYEPTGFYLPAGSTMTVTTQQLSGSTMPSLLIGTYSRDMEYTWSPRSIALRAGTNTIPADAKGGMVWVRYTSNAPSGRVRITFNSGAVRVPVFVKDQTQDWEAQVATYNTTPDALLVNNNTYLVMNLSRAQATSNANANSILQTIDKAVDLGENYISGFDNSAPQHMKPTHKIAMVESNYLLGWGYAYYYRTWFVPGLWTEALTLPNIYNTGWGAWHELGHMRQQPPWTWSTLGEVTVNIYTLAAERAINGGGVNRLKGAHTTNSLAYIANTDPNKNFNSNTYMADENFIRLFMFQQLWFAFGDAFYINLHKQTREQKPVLYSDDQKMGYFMLKACTISGKNLTTFFRKWGFKVSETYYSQIAALNLPAPTVEPSTLSNPVTPTTPPTNPPTTPDLIQNGATYTMIAAVNNTSLLDVSGGGLPANGTPVILWPSYTPPSNNQKWLFRSLGNGEYVIKTMADTTKAMTVSGGYTTDGTQIQVNSYSNMTSQRWKATHLGNGYYNFAPVSAPGKHLDVNGGFTTNGTKIQIWSQHTYNSQKFKLVKL